MNLKAALRADYICWMVLLVSVWMGPVWTTKLAVSIMIIWNGLCITWLSRNVNIEPRQRASECSDPDCNCEAHLEEYTGQNFN